METFYRVINKKLPIKFRSKIQPVFNIELILFLI